MIKNSDMTFVRAKRGFIAVTTTVRSAYSLRAGAYHSRRVEVGIVASVSRDGVVKKVDGLNGGAPKTALDWDSILILDPAKLSNVSGFLAECRDRQSTDPEKYNPFNDLDDVRATARKYV